MPLYKRADSPFWWVQLGRKTRRSTGTTDRAKAEEFERTLTERKWRIEKLGDRGAISFDEAAQRWLESTTRPMNRDRELLNWLSPHIGIEQVREVAEHDAIEVLRKLGLDDGWSHSTVDRMMGTVSAVLKDCERRGEISAPMMPMYRKPTAEPRALTVEELDRLCRQLPMHLALAARVAVHTLLRMRAMLQLTWSRVDLEQRRAWVPSAHQKAARTFGLPLNDKAIFALRALKTIAGPTNPLVFSWGGKPIDDCNTFAFQEAVKRAKVGPLRWHDLRHTGASWAVQSGVTLPELMLYGDWKDYRSVLRYAHLAPSQAAAAADKVSKWAERSHAGYHAEKRARRHK